MTKLGELAVSPPKVGALAFSPPKVGALAARPVFLGVDCNDSSAKPLEPAGGPAWLPCAFSSGRTWAGGGSAWERERERQRERALAGRGRRGRRPPTTLRRGSTGF